METVIEKIGKVSVTVEGIHDYTKKYSRNSIVSTISENNDYFLNSYISIREVPENTPITNTYYWMKLFDNVKEVHDLTIALEKIENIINAKADWNQSDSTKLDYIKNKPNIVQTSGSSTTDVMSQKAVTDLLLDFGVFKVIDTYEHLISLENKSNKIIYLVGPQGSLEDKYEEYIFNYENGQYIPVKIGETSVNLSGYVPTSRKINNKALSSNITLTPSDLEINYTFIDNIINSNYFNDTDTSTIYNINYKGDVHSSDIQSISDLSNILKLEGDFCTVINDLLNTAQYFANYGGNIKEVKGKQYDIVRIFQTLKSLNNNSLNFTIDVEQLDNPHIIRKYSLFNSIPELGKNLSKFSGIDYKDITFNDIEIQNWETLDDSNYYNSLENLFNSENAAIIRVGFTQPDTSNFEYANITYPAFYIYEPEIIKDLFVDKSIQFTYSSIYGHNTILNPIIGQIVFDTSDYLLYVYADDIKWHEIHPFNICKDNDFVILCAAFASKQNTLSNNNKLNTAFINTNTNNRFVTDSEKTEWSNKYYKPESGIPYTHLHSDVKTSLNKADAAYQKPVNGIPSSDMEQSVQISLGKADTALQNHQSLDNCVQYSNQTKSTTQQEKARINIGINNFLWNEIEHIAFEEKEIDSSHETYSGSNIYEIAINDGGRVVWTGDNVGPIDGLIIHVEHKSFYEQQIYFEAHSNFTIFIDGPKYKGVIGDLDCIAGNHYIISFFYGIAVLGEITPFTPNV